jgi:hypothetical protein
MSWTRYRRIVLALMAAEVLAIVGLAATDGVSVVGWGLVFAAVFSIPLWAALAVGAVLRSWERAISLGCQLVLFTVLEVEAISGRPSTGQVISFFFAPFVVALVPGIVLVLGMTWRGLLRLPWPRAPKGV